MKAIKVILLTVLTSTLLFSCFEDQDDSIGNASNLEINNFIYRGMNAYYLYKEDVPELTNGAFESATELNEFLDNYDSPEDLFYNGLLSNQDRFSFLVNDYVALEESFSGITKNTGMKFGLVRYPSDPSLVFGYVRYIVPNSPASTTILERGDIFTSINGTQLTDTNFNSLLAAETYSLGMANFDGETVTETNETVNLTKVELTENPVHLATTLTINGQNIGYLMYNGFIGDFDAQLNEAFGQFQADNVTDLILDLRYNGGGSVESAIDLSSMITGQFTGEIITTEQWNAEIQAAFEAQNPERLVNRFDDRIRTNAATNSLNLNRVYILTSPRTASASEFVINGLNPYIDVVQIGTNTTGKFQASVTLYDAEDFRKTNANPGHRYAIQPLVLKEVNSVGFTDFIDGLEPDTFIEENYANLGILGDPNEPLLSLALQDIAGFAPSQETENSTHLRTTSLEEIGESNMNSPLYQKMYKEDLSGIPLFN